jgi:hypothetical protein
VERDTGSRSGNKESNLNAIFWLADLFVGVEKRQALVYDAVKKYRLSEDIPDEQQQQQPSLGMLFAAGSEDEQMTSNDKDS